MARVQADKSLEINEGDFFFVEGRGMMMAHYPGRSLGSKFSPRNGDLNWQGNGRQPAVKRNTLMLVSLVPMGNALLHDRKDDHILHPAPNEEELEEAIRIAAQKEFGTQLTDALYSQLSGTGKLSDLARIGRIANANITSGEHQHVFNGVHQILSGVAFYHGFLAQNPREKRILTARNAADRFQQSFKEYSDQVIARGIAVAKELHANGEMLIHVEPEPSAAEKRKQAKAAKKAERKKDKPTPAAAKGTEITDQQRALVQQAKDYASKKYSSNEDLERLASLFEIGKIGFQETVVSLRHTFAEPSAPPPRRDLESGRVIREAVKATAYNQDAIQETIDILNHDEPEETVDISAVIAMAKRANRKIKKAFESSRDHQPQQVSRMTSVIDGWRPLEY